MEFLLSVIIVTVLLASTMKKDPNSGFGIVAAAGRIDLPLMMERETTGNIYMDFSQKTISLVKYKSCNLITYRNRFYSYKMLIMHMMDAQRKKIHKKISKTILPDLTMVGWKLVILSAAR